MLSRLVPCNFSRFVRTFTNLPSSGVPRVNTQITTSLLSSSSRESLLSVLSAYGRSFNLINYSVLLKVHNNLKHSESLKSEEIDDILLQIEQLVLVEWKRIQPRVAANLYYYAVKGAQKMHTAKRYEKVKKILLGRCEELLEEMAEQEVASMLNAVWKDGRYDFLNENYNRILGIIQNFHPRPLSMIYRCYSHSNKLIPEAQIAFGKNLIKFKESLKNFSSLDFSTILFFVSRAVLEKNDFDLIMEEMIDILPKHLIGPSASIFSSILASLIALKDQTSLTPQIYKMLEDNFINSYEIYKGTPQIASLFLQMLYEGKEIKGGPTLYEALYSSILGAESKPVSKDLESCLYFLPTETLRQENCVTVLQMVEKKISQSLDLAKDGNLGYGLGLDNIVLLSIGFSKHAGFYTPSEDILASLLAKMQDRLLQKHTHFNMDTLNNCLRSMSNFKLNDSLILRYAKVVRMYAFHVEKRTSEYDKACTDIVQLIDAFLRATRVLESSTQLVVEYIPELVLSTFKAINSALENGPNDLKPQDLEALSNFLVYLASKDHIYKGKTHIQKGLKTLLHLLQRAEKHTTLEPLISGLLI